MAKHSKRSLSIILTSFSVLSIIVTVQVGRNTVGQMVYPTRSDATMVGPGTTMPEANGYYDTTTGVGTSHPSAVAPSTHYAPTTGGSYSSVTSDTRYTEGEDEYERYEEDSSDDEEMERMIEEYRLREEEEQRKREEEERRQHEEMMRYIEQEQKKMKEEEQKRKAEEAKRAEEEQEKMEEYYKKYAEEERMRIKQEELRKAAEQKKLEKYYKQYEQEELRKEEELRKLKEIEAMKAAEYEKYMRQSTSESQHSAPTTQHETYEKYMETYGEQDDAEEYETYQQYYQQIPSTYTEEYDPSEYEEYEQYMEQYEGDYSERINPMEHEAASESSESSAESSESSAASASSTPTDVEYPDVMPPDYDSGEEPHDHDVLRNIRPHVFEEEMSLQCFTADGTLSTNREDCVAADEEYVEEMIEQQLGEDTPTLHDLSEEEEVVIEEKMEIRFAAESAAKMQQKRQKLAEALVTVHSQMNAAKESGSVNEESEKFLTEAQVWIEQQIEQVQTADTSSVTEAADALAQIVEATESILPPPPKHAPDIGGITARVGGILEQAYTILSNASEQGEQLDQELIEHYQQATAVYADVVENCPRNKAACSRLNTVLDHLEEMREPLSVLQ